MPDIIVRNSTNGQRLDVAGVNTITVLLDRSETEFTEIGVNTWKPHFTGPPHRHDDKDQVFFVIAGSGVVKAADERYAVGPGCLVYVPAGVVHQSITTGDEPLSYLLLNVFTDRHKEGHATFEQHIEMVKLIRKRQAESQRESEIDGRDGRGLAVNRPKFLEGVRLPVRLAGGTNRSHLVLGVAAPRRFELSVDALAAGATSDVVSHGDRERSLYVLEGSGALISGGRAQPIARGDLIYVSPNTPYATEPGAGGLTCLSLSSMLDG